MNGILLPGWNLAGRLPSISSLSRDNGQVALVGPISSYVKPGQLIRVPRVISMLIAVEGNQTSGGKIVVNTPEFARVKAVFVAIIARVAAAMPDAIVSSGQYIGLYPAPVGLQSVMPVIEVPSGVPYVGCDYLDIVVGSWPSTVGIDSAAQALQDQLSNMAGYAIRSFVLAWPDDAASGYAGPGDFVSAAASLGYDATIEGSSDDATEDSIAALINDHFGVAI
jgi:hypothetical protein